MAELGNDLLVVYILGHESTLRTYVESKELFDIRLVSVWGLFLNPVLAGTKSKWKPRNRLERGLISFENQSGRY